MQETLLKSQLISWAGPFLVTAKHFKHLKSRHYSTFSTLQLLELL